MKYPTTPDGKYFVVRGRLWRCSDPCLDADTPAVLTRELMSARRAEGAAMRAGDDQGREAARARVDAAKQARGERGPVWWTDGAPDYNRYMAKTPPYADWWATQEGRSGRSWVAAADGLAFRVLFRQDLCWGWRWYDKFWRACR